MAEAKGIVPLPSNEELLTRQLKDTASRLAECRERNQALTEIIRKRDERIVVLTESDKRSERIINDQQKEIEELRRQIVYRPVNPKHVARLREIRADLKHDLLDLIEDMKGDR